MPYQEDSLLSAGTSSYIATQHHPPAHFPADPSSSFISSYPNELSTLPEDSKAGGYDEEGLSNVMADEENEMGSDDGLSEGAFEEKMEDQLGLWRPTERENRASRDVLVRRNGELSEDGSLVSRSLFSFQTCFVDWITLSFRLAELYATAQKVMRSALRALDRDQWKHEPRPSQDRMFAPPFSRTNVRVLRESPATS